MHSKSVGPAVNFVNNTDPTITASSFASDSKYTSGTNTPTGLSDERRRRKFIVTPAEEIPLRRNYPSNEADV